MPCLRNDFVTHACIKQDNRENIQMKEPGWIWYKLRGALIVPVYLFAMVFTWHEHESWIIYPLGGVLFTAGWILRVWAQMHLHYRLKERKILTRTGPYAHVRNPIYIGNTLILVGVTVLAELLWLAPIMLICCALTYTLVVRYEEKHLAGKYGEPYIEYLQKVPRWIPAMEKPHPVAPLKNLRDYLLPSIWAEVHIFLLLIPVAIKEMICTL